MFIDYGQYYINNIIYLNARFFNMKRAENCFNWTRLPTRL